MHSLSVTLQQMFLYDAYTAHICQVNNLYDALKNNNYNNNFSYSTTTSEQFRFKSKQRVNEQKRKQLKRRMAKFLDQVKHNQKSINYLQIN